MPAISREASFRVPDRSTRSGQLLKPHRTTANQGRYQSSQAPSNRHYVWLCSHFQTELQAGEVRTKALRRLCTGPHTNVPHGAVYARELYVTRSVICASHGDDDFSSSVPLSEVAHSLRGLA